MDRLTKLAHFLVVRMTSHLRRQVVYTGNCPVIWSVSLYHIGSGSPVHGSVLEEFPEGHGDIDEDEHNVSSVDGRTVKEDYPGFGGHAVSIRPGLQGWLR